MGMLWAMNQTIRFNRKMSHLLAAISLLFSSLAMASADQDFKRGLELFRSADYAAAVTKFIAAEKQGLTSVSLYYNLGSSYYKLGEYDKAKKYFNRVKKFPAMRDLAEYNLGLIAEKTGNTVAARQHFSSARSITRDQKLRLMADRKLTGMASTSKPWLVYLSGNLGYDDNITAAPSGLVQNISDNFYDVFVSADRVVAGTRRQGWSVDASYFSINYFDNSNYDDGQLSVGIKKQQRLADWRVRAHLSFNKRDYGNDAFQSIVKLDLQGINNLSRDERLYLRYIYEDISSDNALYDYLQGWRQRARIEYRNYQRKHISKIYYELELNDRQDIDVAGFVASYSPTRHSIRGQYTYILDTRWSVTGDLSYRMSDYPTTISQDRQDDRWRMLADVDYRIDKTTKLRGRLEYINNASTLNVYDYDKSVISVGISKLF